MSSVSPLKPPSLFFFFNIYFSPLLFSFICSQDAPEEQLLNLSIIYTIGYALSFSALVIATAILLGFR